MRTAVILRQRGSALIYTLLTLTVFSVLLSIIYERVIGLMRSSRDWMWMEKSLAASESGLAASEALLLNNPVWSAGENQAPELRFVLDESEVTARTDRIRPPDIIWLFSTGSYKHRKKESVRPVILIDPTLYAIMARNCVKLGMGTIVTGSIFGSDVRIEEGSEVVGSIISGGVLHIARDQSEAVVFDSATAAPEVPRLDFKKYDNVWTQSLAAGPIESTIGPGLYRSAKDVTIRDATETGVSILVNGDLILEGKVVMRLPPTTDTPLFMVEKNLMGNLAGSRLRGVIYVKGKVSLKGEGLITGTLIADDVELSDGVVVQSFDAVHNEQRPRANFWRRKIRRIRN